MNSSSDGEGLSTMEIPLRTEHSVKASIHCLKVYAEDFPEEDFDPKLVFDELIADMEEQMKAYAYRIHQLMRQNSKQCFRTEKMQAWYLAQIRQYKDENAQIMGALGHEGVAVCRCERMSPEPRMPEGDTESFSTHPSDYVRLLKAENHALSRELTRYRSVVCEIPGAVDRVISSMASLHDDAALAECRKSCPCKEELEFLENQMYEAYNRERELRLDLALTKQENKTLVEELEVWENIAGKRTLPTPPPEILSRTEQRLRRRKKRRKQSAKSEAE